MRLIYLNCYDFFFHFELIESNGWGQVEKGNVGDEVLRALVGDKNEWSCETEGRCEWRTSGGWETEGTKCLERWLVTRTSGVVKRTGTMWVENDWRMSG